MKRLEEVHHGEGVARLRGCRRERGAAIAEFAVVSILLWLLLAGTLELGRAFAAQQILQNAASSAARDLALRELPANFEFDPALGAGAREVVFLDGFLVADAALLARCGGANPELSLAGVRRYFDEQNVPALNRLLLPLWIRDVVDGQEVLRYPGAVLSRSAATGACSDGSQYTVRIPEVLNGGGIAWRNVVEPVAMPETPAPPPGVPADPFPLANGGWASLQVLYPFQAVGLQGWETGPSGGQRMIDAVDPVVPPPSGLGFVSTEADGAYGGTYGLGRLYAWNREVRPYRRVLSASAAFRREVFAPDLGATP